MNATSAPRSEIDGLSASVVVYRPDLAELASTVASLGVASDALHARRPSLPVDLYLVDNGGLPDVSAELAALRAHNVTTTVLAGHGNIGYGRGHNLAIERATRRYHLVLNPDTDPDREPLVRALD